MTELDSRKKSILQAIVFEYVTCAEPVGSEMLVKKYELGVKSATVRNEMADLSDLGYLEQPHTSAGRIPSDLGYRYYVDNLIVTRDPAPTTKQRVKGAADEGDALQELLTHTTRALSRLTHLLTAAMIVHDPNLAIRSAIISAMGPQQALLVLVMNNGRVENRMLECPIGLTLQDIGQANEMLTASIVNKPVRSLMRSKAPVTGQNSSLDKLLSSLWSSIKSISKELTKPTMTTEGEEYLFAQPEFHRDATSLTNLLDTLKESDVLIDALSDPTDQPQTVTIGRENRYEQLHQLSVIRQSFYVGENEAGVIALVGPTRMQYDSSIPLVNYTAKALSDSLSKFFG